VVRAPEFIHAIYQRCVYVILEVQAAGKLRAIDNTHAALPTRNGLLRCRWSTSMKFKRLRLVDSHHQVYMMETATSGFHFVMSSAFDSSGWRDRQVEGWSEASRQLV
jgi:hypothetical protein